PEGFKNISPPEGLNQQGVCENYVYNKNDVIPSRFSGEGPCVLQWSFMELRNARSLGQGPRDDDLQFSHTLKPQPKKPWPRCPEKGRSWVPTHQRKCGRLSLGARKREESRGLSRCKAAWGFFTR